MTDVAVDVTADNAAAARDKGLMEAEGLAFDQLAARLSMGEAAHRPDNATLASLVQSFDIQNENPRAGRYIGTLSVQFKPGPTRAYLQKKGRAFSEARSQPLVLLPILHQGGRKILWEETTPWRAAWEKVSTRTGLVPLILPVGDAADAALLDANGAEEGRGEALAALAQKYQAGGVVVAVIDAVPQTPWSLTIKRFDAHGAAQEALQPISLEASSAKDQTAVWAKAVGDVQQGLEKKWKQENQATAKAMEGPVSTLRVRAGVSSLAAWNDLRDRMSHVPGVARVTVTRMSRGAIDADVLFHGDLASLPETMAAAGVVLKQTPQGWLVENP